MDENSIALKAAALLPKAMEVAASFLTTVNDKARYDFRVAHSEYCTNIALKYCRSRTFFVRDEPQFIDEFYVPASIIRGGRARLDKANLDTLSAVSRKTIVCGNGGSGKTVFMKYLIMDAIERGVGYPVFIELRNLNERSGAIDLESEIFQVMSDHGFPLGKDFALRSLRDGLLVVLLDGFDEVNVEKRKLLEAAIKRLASRNSSQVVVSSRPDMVLEGWDGFASTTIAPLELEEACELIERIHIDDDDEVKSRFIKSLRNGLFKTHKYFLSNPLLLSIMLLTYGDSADIPSKFSSFYEQAYTALFQKHDALKSGYKRERRTSLDIYAFARIFSAFSAITYDKTAFRFSVLDAIEYMRQAKKVVGLPDVSEEGFLQDAKQAVCLLVDDGLDLAYVHRSFQEYFVARFINSSDESMQRAYIGNLASRDDGSIDVDNVMGILYEMSPDIVERFYLIPKLDAFFGKAADRKLSLSAWKILVSKVFSGVRAHDRGDVSFSIRSHRYLSLVLFAGDRCSLGKDVRGRSKVGEDLAQFLERESPVLFDKVSAKSAFWRELAGEPGRFSLSGLETVRKEFLAMKKRAAERSRVLGDAFSFIPASKHQTSQVKVVT